MKLSRAGWNNVIIFSVMSMILLINQMNQGLFDGGETSGAEEQFIIERHSAILTLEVNQQLVIERIGRTWRATPAKITGQALDQMMLAWQDNSGTKVEAPDGLEQVSAVIVTMHLAGQEQPQVFSLYPAADQLFLYRHSDNSWLSLPLPIYQQLLPQILLQ
ncbi:hypothetical protein SG34_001080 [Thalassomonas viridans]|uniref:DUF4340 domain-containing protein n=1 Tax=Thalassomonas viridans TaxID=137584 RepID=A0AAE9Z2F4_9GAMM|nr:hypothetical protein [Thalassomonas viridans]WDE05571.1 hypothetical protein SG34_001080 [Thalassomonas viridans]